MPPVYNLQVTVKGQKYDIDEANTVKDLQEKVVEASGAALDSHKVLFQGKRLQPSDLLSEVGVSDGSQLSVVPSTSSSTTSSGSKKKKATTATSTSPSTPVTSAMTSSESSTDTAAAMKEYLQKSGVDPTKLDEMMNNPPDMQESIKAMGEMMNSPIFQEYMNDPEKLEQSRQMIMNNPMLKSMMGSMPGFEEILNDKDAWREAMQAAADLYKNMDSQDLMNQMMSMGQQNPGAGLFDMQGMFDSSPAAQALDELDEDD